MENSKKGDFRDLEVWRHCRDIRNSVWNLTHCLPPQERYNLANQMTRASRSTTACIAEGYGRYHFQENIQFCRQSRGSLFELIDHVDVAVDCGYIKADKANEMIDSIKNAIRLLNGYIRYLKGRKDENKS